MTIEHVKIFTPEHTFRTGTIEIRGERIAGVRFEDPEAAGGDGDGSGDSGILYAVPGFIDLHLHGCIGRDVCDADPASLRDIAAYQLQNGVTGFVPATLTLPDEELMRILNIIKNYVNQQNAKRKTDEEQDTPAADILGIQMEGPFISAAKKGAQDGRYIRKADKGLVEAFMQASGNLVKILGIAPEQNDMALIRELYAEAMADKSGKHPAMPHISLAHTDASYEDAVDAFLKGADHVTHICNAMPVFHHREPGVIGAAFDACVIHGRKDITVELICDGVHVHPAMVRTVFRMFGAEHVILISDSMRGTGLPDGIYKLGDLDVEVNGSRAVLCPEKTPVGDGKTALDDRPLAGSVTNLFSCFQTAVRQMQIPLAQVLPCVTENPAKKLSVYHERGSIETGKLADILLLDKDLHLKQVIKGGKKRIDNRSQCVYNEHNKK